MNLLCWAWGHKADGARIEEIRIPVREPLTGPWQEFIDSPFMTHRQLELAVGLVSYVPYLQCRIARVGHEIFCGRCRQSVETVKEAEQARKVVDNWNEFRFVDGWLRRLVMPFFCMITGHEAMWHRDMAMRVDREVCVHCRAQFRAVTDRERRLQCQPR